MRKALPGEPGFWWSSPGEASLRTAGLALQSPVRCVSGCFSSRSEFKSHLFQHRCCRQPRHGFKAGLSRGGEAPAGRGGCGPPAPGTESWGTVGAGSTRSLHPHPVPAWCGTVVSHGELWDAPGGMLKAHPAVPRVAAGSAGAAPSVHPSCSLPWLSPGSV